MAKKRMFHQSIVRSDDFLDMPVTSQLLYYSFGMIADDDGIVPAYQRELRYLGFGNIDDIKILIAKNFITMTDDGRVIMITHWLKNNTLQKDRYTPSDNQEAVKEFKAKGIKFISCKKNGNKMETDVFQNVSTVKSKSKNKYSIDKDIDKEKESEKKDFSSVFEEIIKIFVSHKKSNTNKRVKALKEFIQLSDEEKEQALEGAKNYFEFYKLEQDEKKQAERDSEYRYTVNIYDFIANAVFKEYIGNHYKEMKKDFDSTGYEEFDTLFEQ